MLLLNGKPRANNSSWKFGIRYTIQSLIVILVLGLVVSAICFTGHGKSMQQFQTIKVKNSLQSCDLFSGKWVYDNKSIPLYKEQECPSLTDDFACEKFGRKEFNYRYFRWQPDDCDLPRFSATEFLEKLRGKRLVFVGDSINRNQWASLLCMVESSIPSLLKTLRNEGNLFTFKAKEYNASIDFYWEPLVVESNCDDPDKVNHRKSYRIIRVNEIEKHASHWTDSDILIFNTYMWWLLPNMKILGGSSGISEEIYTEEGKYLNLQMALKTWSKWLENNVNRRRTKLFFTSLSPSHRDGPDWGKDGGENCYGETEPIWNESDWKRSCSNRAIMRIVKTTIDDLKSKGVQVQILNITHISEYRKEAHPSVYRRQFVPLTKEQLSNPKSYSDCVHWCLPGVPDVWNEILYAYLVHYL